MRVCVLLLLLVACGSFAHEVTMFDIRNLWKKTILTSAPECIYEGRLKGEIMDRFYKYGEITDDSSWKCFLKCCHVKLQIFSPTNEVDVKKWAATFDYLDLSLARKCGNIVESEPCEKSHLMVKCVHDELSKHFPQ